LTSVVHHLGNHAFAGHYVTSAYAQPVEASDACRENGEGNASRAVSSAASGGRWVLYNDAATTLTDEAAVLERAEESGYIYFFTALGP
jgi:uncharacterized UBP type Zn finger protein